VARQPAPPDPVERVSLAVPVPEAGLLGAAADLVERGVGQADDVEVVDHQAGVGQPGGDRGGVGLVGVDHHMVDPHQPSGGLRVEPAGDRGGAASRQTSTRRPVSRSMIPVTSRVGCSAVAVRNAGGCAIRHTVNDAVVAHGTPLDDDPGRNCDVDALGLDETLFCRQGR
jgi:hypothetical protein